MTTRVLRASPLTVGVVVVIAAVSLVGFYFTKHSNDQQEQRALASDANQASLYVSSVFANIGSLLDTVGTAVKFTDASPAVFQQQTAPYAKQLSTVLARRQGASYVAVVASGSAFTTGQTMPPAISAALASAGATSSPGPVTFNGKRSVVGFSVGPPVVPAGMAIYMQFSISPFVASPVTSAQPFNALKVALYGSGTASRSSLVVATTQQLPLSGTTVMEHPKIGSSHWTLVASARSPLTGSFAREAPFIFLGLGLIIAVVLAITVEMLERRHRYAAQLVHERTADLNKSLDDLRAAQAALVRGERLTALGEMATVVGHELRNPLAAVTNSLFLLRRSLGEPAEPHIEKHLGMAERETGKAAALAEDLTSFVRPRVPDKDLMEFAPLVEEVVEATPPPAAVNLDVNVAPVSLRADRRQIGEVLANLVTNAYQAVGKSGTVRIEVEPNGSGVNMSVEDSGPGIDRESADRAFEPFFTTKHDGTGLGLAIVRRLVEGHGGDVSFADPEPGRGAKVVVHIPDEPVEVSA